LLKGLLYFALDILVARLHLCLLGACDHLQFVDDTLYSAHLAGIGFSSTLGILGGNDPKERYDPRVRFHIDVERRRSAVGEQAHLGCRGDPYITGSIPNSGILTGLSSRRGLAPDLRIGQRVGTLDLTGDPLHARHPGHSLDGSQVSTQSFRRAGQQHHALVDGLYRDTAVLERRIGLQLLLDPLLKSVIGELNRLFALGGNDLQQITHLLYAVDLLSYALCLGLLLSGAHLAV